MNSLDGFDFEDDDFLDLEGLKGKASNRDDKKNIGDDDDTIADCISDEGITDSLSELKFTSLERSIGSKDLRIEDSDSSDTSNSTKRSNVVKPVHTKEQIDRFKGYVFGQVISVIDRIYLDKVNGDQKPFPSDLDINGLEKGSFFIKKPGKAEFIAITFDGDQKANQFLADTSYLNNQLKNGEIRNRYLGKYIVAFNKEIIGSGNTKESAIYNSRLHLLTKSQLEYILIDNPVIKIPDEQLKY